MKGVRVTALTARGAVRPDNQDAVLVLDWVSQSPRPRVVEVHADWTPPLVCAVADGLGGHSAGDLASRLAMGELAARYISWDSAQAIRDGLTAISGALHDTAVRSPVTAGMRTTVAGILLGPEGVYTFNVGDSRVYRVTDGYVEQLSSDDAVSGSIVTQSLGDTPEEPIRPHVSTAPLDPAGGRFLLCTDGVHGQIDERAMRRACRAPEARAVVECLRDAVYGTGAADNLSAVVVDLAP